MPKDDKVEKDKVRVERVKIKGKKIITTSKGQVEIDDPEVRTGPRVKFGKKVNHG